MADPKILYNNLFSDKLYTKSYDDFLKQFEEDEAAQKLHNKLSQDGLYTKDFDSFKTQFKLGKSNDPVQETASVGLENLSSTDSKLDPGSSVSAPSRANILTGGASKFTPQEQEDFKYFENIRTRKSNAVSFQDFTEEKVQPELMKRFGKYGFVFEETGIGDFVKVSTTDAENPVTKTFKINKRDLFRGGNSFDELEEFVKANKKDAVGYASPKKLEEFDLKEFQKLKKSMIESGVDGKVQFKGSSGEMYDEDQTEELFADHWYASRGFNYKDIKNLKNKSKNNQERINFIEQLQFKTTRYQQPGSVPIPLTIKLLAPGIMQRSYQGTEEEIKKYPEYFDQNGFAKRDILKSELEKFKKENKDYSNITTNPDFLKAEGDLNLFYAEIKNKAGAEIEKEIPVIEQEQKKLQQEWEQAYDLEFNNKNFELKVNEFNSQIDNATKEIEQIIGSDISKLEKYKPKSKEENDLLNSKIDALNTIVNNAKPLNDFSTKHSALYQRSKNLNDLNEISTMLLNFDDVQRTRGEYTDQYKNFLNNIKSGWSSGKINSTIMSELYGGVDMDNPEDAAEVAKLIATEKAYQQGILNSRVYEQYLNADSVAEQLKLLGQNPFEISTALFGNSMSQLIRSGSKIFFPIVGGGAAIGGAPTAAKALQAWTAIAGFGMEYGNAYLDVMQENQIDITNAETVEKALMNPEIQSQAREKGIKRGIPIAIANFMSAKAAGMMVKPLATGGEQFTRALGSQLIVQPGFEFSGEMVAQQTAGEDLSFTEGFNEAIGGIGGTYHNVAFEMYKNSTKGFSVKLAKNLTNLDNMVNGNYDGKQVIKFVDRLKKKKFISEEVGNQILENSQFLDEANAKLGNKANNKNRARLADLLHTRKMITDQNTKSNKLGDIDQEISKLSSTGELSESGVLTFNDYIKNYEKGIKNGLSFLKSLGVADDVTLVESDENGNFKFTDDISPELQEAVNNSNAPAFVTPYTEGSKQLIFLNKKLIRTRGTQAQFESKLDVLSAAMPHEVLHAVLDRTFTDAEIINISKDLNNYLQEQSGKGISEGTVNNILSRLKGTYGEYNEDGTFVGRKQKDGRVYTEAEYAQEVFTAISDEINIGNIDWKRQDTGFWQNFADKINDYFKYKLKLSADEINKANIKTGQQAFDFLKNYNKTFAKSGRVKLGPITTPKAPVKEEEIKTRKAEFNMELESDRLKGIAKLNAMIQENEDMGPNNAIMRRGRREQIESQIEKVNELETQNTANELRKKLKNAKGINRENIQLALQEKFAAFEGEVETAGLDIETGKFRSSDVVTDLGKEFKKDLDEGLITNELLAQTFNSPSTNNSSKFSITEAIVEHNWPVISSALKFTPSGPYTMENVKDAVKEQLNGIFPAMQGFSARKIPVLKNYTGPEKVTTYLSSVFGRRKAEIFERAKKMGDQVLEESFSTETMTETEFKETTTTKETRVNPLEYKNVKNNVDAIKDAVKVNEKNYKGLTYKKLSDKFAGKVGSIMFDIPANKIDNPKANLTYAKRITDGIPESSEAGNIQRDLADANEVRKFVKSLAPENISGDISVLDESGLKVEVSKEAKNLSIGLPRNVLNFFYDNTGKRRQNSFVHKLKPEFTGKILNETIEKVQSEFAGITEAGQLNNYDRKIGQNLKGYAKVKAANTVNKIATDKIESLDIKPDAKQQARADAAAGKSNFLYSDVGLTAEILPQEKADSILDREFILEAETAIEGRTKIINKVLKHLGIEEAFDLQTEKGIDNFVEALKNHVFPYFPKDAFFATKAIMRVSDRIAGKMDAYYQEKLEELKNDDSIVYGENYTYTNEEGKKVDIDNLSQSSYDTMIKTPEKIARNLIPGKDGKSPIKKWNEKNMRIHRAMWERTNEAIKNDPTESKEAARALAVYYSFVSNNKNHPHRLGAEFVGYSLNPEGAVNKNGILKLYEMEHAMPATGAYAYLFDSILTNRNFKADYNAIVDNYKLIALDAKENKKLAKGGVGTSMLPGWKVMSNFWWQRYFNTSVGNIDGGIDVNNIIFTDGKSIGQTFGINNQGEFATKQTAKNNLKKAPLLRGSDVNTDNNNSVLDKAQKIDDMNAKMQQSYFNEVDLDADFNKIIEETTGVAKEKRYSDAKAKVAGRKKGRFDIFIPPQAEDFMGLMYKFMGKGKLGEGQIAWVKENILDPFARGINNLSNARMAMLDDFNAMKKQVGIKNRDLTTEIPGEPYTKEDAVRVYAFNKAGHTIPGLSKTDEKKLVNYVRKDPKLKEFADGLIATYKNDSYPKPDESWVAGTIGLDMAEHINSFKRSNYLTQFNENIDKIFTKQNLNKLEALYGKKYRAAVEDIIRRMKSGINRKPAKDSMVQGFIDWMTGSIGVTMFFNTRSALLQTISTANFINYSDNNMFKAGLAFANQKQFWKDFINLFNSKYLRDRRGGLKLNVSESDIASIAKKRGAKGVIAKILQVGFLPTQMADSFAISLGGASFYRNRVKTYEKQGMTTDQAEAQAFLDFKETAEESQQSSRPDKISKEQASELGRLVLAWANTPAQYARIKKKDILDMINRRKIPGKTLLQSDLIRMQRIAYYAVIQNIIFNALQKGLFALAFTDEEEEEYKRKYFDVGNSMADSILRGMGTKAAFFSVAKNAIIKLMQESNKKNPDYEKVADEFVALSPPIDAKFTRLKMAARSLKWDMDEMKSEGIGLKNPAWMAGANVTAALTNVPVDRVLRKYDHVSTAVTQDLDAWQRIALLGGWTKYQLGVDEDSKPRVKPANHGKKYKNLRTPKLSGGNLRSPKLRK